MLKYKYILQIKYTEAILSNSTQKLLWFEIIKMLIAVLKSKFIYCVVYYNFRHTFVPYWDLPISEICRKYFHNFLSMLILMDSGTCTHTEIHKLQRLRCSQITT